MDERVRRHAGGPIDRDAIIDSLERDGLFVMEWTDEAGVRYPEHSHPHREVRVVLEGSFTLGTAQGTTALGPGDRIVLEPGTVHWMEVGPDGARYLAATSRFGPDGGG